MDTFAVTPEKCYKCNSRTYDTVVLNADGMYWGYVDTDGIYSCPQNKLSKSSYHLPIFFIRPPDIQFMP